MTDHRKHSRKQVDLRIGFRIGGGPRLEASCHDLSLGGMFVETSAPAPYGVEVEILITLPDLAQEAVLRATVRWSTKAGMGVQFGPTGARETHGLTELIAGR